MQKHLDGDCTNCRKTVDMWTSMAELFKREVAFTPPASALRIAESYLVPFKLASRQTRVLQLARPTFDSFTGQAIEGVRGFDPVPQQLMYQCGNVVIDLRLEPRPAQHSIVLAGQIVDSGQSGEGLAGLPVSLLAGEEPWLDTTTSQLGEFHFSFRPARHLKLLFGMKDTAWLVLLPDTEAGTA